MRRSLGDNWIIICLRSLDAGIGFRACLLQEIETGILTKDYFEFLKLLLDTINISFYGYDLACGEQCFGKLRMRPLSNA